MTISIPPPGYVAPEGGSFEEAIIRRITWPIDACPWCYDQDEPCAYCSGETSEEEQWIRLLGWRPRGCVWKM